MYLIIGDKRRDIDLEFVMEIQNILELPAHPPPWIFLDESVMDSTLLFGTMWTIFILYVWIVCFISWHICIEDMVRPWVALTQASSMLQNKNNLHIYWFLNILWSSIMDPVSAQPVGHLCCIQCRYHIRDMSGEHSCVPSWTSNCIVISANACLYSEVFGDVSGFKYCNKWTIQNEQCYDELYLILVRFIFVYTYKEISLFLISSESVDQLTGRYKYRHKNVQ